MRAFVLLFVLFNFMSVSLATSNETTVVVDPRETTGDSPTIFITILGMIIAMCGGYSK